MSAASAAIEEVDNEFDDYCFKIHDGLRKGNELPFNKGLITGGIVNQTKYDSRFLWLIIEYNGTPILMFLFAGFVLPFFNGETKTKKGSPPIVIPPIAIVPEDCKYTLSKNRNLFLFFYNLIDVTKIISVPKNYTLPQSDNSTIIFGYNGSMYFPTFDDVDLFSFVTFEPCKKRKREQDAGSKKYKKRNTNKRRRRTNKRRTIRKKQRRQKKSRK
jgi:hypothetical protein